MYGQLKDVTALLARIAVGVVFLAHGLQKWDAGLDGVTAMVTGMGIPLPTLTALFLMVIESAGAVAFIVGTALPVLGILFAIDMIGAIFFVHLDAGLTGQSGYELVLGLGAATLALSFSGGWPSLGHPVLSRRRTRKGELQNA
jgi:putative oxidoreductase